jgi:hypothetical protein
MDEGEGQVSAGGEVEVGEEDKAGAQEGVLGGEGFFYFYDEVGAVKEPGVVVLQIGAGGGVVFVAIAGAEAGGALDEDLVAALYKLVDAGGEQADAVLLVLDLAWDADDHRLN